MCPQRQHPYVLSLRPDGLDQIGPVAYDRRWRPNEIFWKRACTKPYVFVFHNQVLVLTDSWIFGDWEGINYKLRKVYVGLEPVGLNATPKSQRRISNQFVDTCESVRN